MTVIPVAFWFETLTKNNRNAYVKHHIPFIMVPTQIYLPFLGILFSKKMTKSNSSVSGPGGRGLWFILEKWATNPVPPGPLTELLRQRESND